jgi:hypothetical protein
MHPRRLENNANITFNRRCSRRRFHMVEEERLDGSNYGADAVIMSISQVVSPIVSICGGKRKRGSRLRTYAPGERRIRS